MKKLIAALVIIALVALVARGVLRSLERAEIVVPTIDEIQAEQGVPVEVAMVRERTVQQVRIYSGTLKGIAQADATAKTMERVEDILVRVGARVKQGQVLAKLSRDNPGARFQQAQLALELAEKDYNRMKALYEGGAISAQDLDRQENAYKIAQTDFASVEELLNVRSPLDGVVMDIFPEPGETVEGGQEVVRVARLDQMELEIAVSESDIGLVSRGQSAEITVASYENRSFEGTVNHVALSADPRTRKFEVRFRLANPKLELRPGTFATARLVIDNRAGTIVVPKDCLVETLEGIVAFVVTGTGMAERRFVKRGVVADSEAEVLEGLTPGERIVVLGQNKLRGGEKLLIAD